MANDGSPESVLLGQAIAAYISTLAAADRESSSRELSRFARWIGADVAVRRITAADIGRYQEGFPESSVDLNQRLEPVKVFLTQLKTKKYTDINLGAHVRLRRTQTRRSAALNRPEAESLRMTEEGFAALTQELATLETVVRPQVTEELTRAAADRDYRENAPYDAAKQRLGEIQGRINSIRAMLSAADIQTANADDVVDLGMTVTLQNLNDADEVIYTIVGPGEVNLRERKISAQSPVGSALMNKRPGDIIEVATPAGAETYRIQHIERRRTAGATAS